jgi:hypothetical protein
MKTRVAVLLLLLTAVGFYADGKGRFGMPDGVRRVNWDLMSGVSLG